MSTNETTLSNRSITQLGQLLGAHRREMREELERFATELTRGAAGSSAGHGYGVRNVATDAKRQRDEVDKMIASLKRNQKALTAYEQYMLGAAKRHRTELTRQIQAQQEATRAQEDNTEAVGDNTDAQQDNTQRIREASENTKRFVRGLAEGTLYLKGLKEVVSEFQTSYRLGFKWEPIMDAFQGALMGMDPKAMMEFQAQFRRTSGAMAGGIDGFNKAVSANQMQMIQYTGSLHSAAVAMGSMYEMSHNMGLELSAVAGSADTLFSEFKRMQAVTSITVDQFIEMNQRMLSNSDIQAKLLGLNERQRVSYIQGLNQQQLALQMMGLQKEVAEGLIAATEKLSNDKGINRLADSHKRQQFLQSALGWDQASAAQVGQLSSKKFRTPEEDIQLQKYMMQISEEMQQRMAAGMTLNGVTTLNEVQIQAIAESLGVSEWANLANTAALQQSAVTDQSALAKHQTELAERQTEWLQNIAKYTSAISDMMGAWSSTAAAVLAGAVVATLLNRSTLVERMVERIFNRGGTVNGNGSGGRGPAGSRATRGGRFGRMMSGVGGRFTGIGGGVAGLGIGLAGGIAADQLLNPADYRPDQHKSVSAAQGALQWGSAGAGIGMLFGPLGAAIGGAAGGLYGLYRNLNEYSKDYAAQMNSTLYTSSKMLTGEQVRLQAEKQSKEEQLRILKEQNKTSAEHLRIIEQTKKELSQINSKMEVANVKSQAMGIGVASKYLEKMLSDGQTFSDTGDVGKRAASLQSMLGMAGVQGNVKDALMQNIQNAALSGGLSNQAWGDLPALQSALASGSDESIPREWRRYVDQGFTTTATQFKSQLDAQMATVSEKLPDGMLSSAIDSQTSDIVGSRTKIEQLEKEVEQMRVLASMDPYGVGSPGLASKERELEQAKQQLAAQRDAANVLSRSASGEIPLSVKLPQEDLDNFARKIAEETRRAASRPPSVATPQFGVR